MLILLLACADPDPAPQTPDDTAESTDTSGSDTAGTEDPADTGTAEVIVEVTWAPEDFADVIDVGPDHPYETPSAVPWESLTPSTLVRIHARAEPYRDKWVISTAATEDEPLVVLGVGGPVISGEGATTRRELDYWNEDRSVIKIGGSSSSPETPSWVHLQGLTIQSGHPDYTFTDDSGSPAAYIDNAAAVFVESGSHITIRDSTLTDCGNGLFVASGASDVLIAQNYIHGNGIIGGYLQHNTYTEALRITYEYNRLGPLQDGADGNNLKDRSAGTTIRYNWIEGGNRQLDLVETGTEALLSDPDYRTTRVYGNILIEPEDAGNSQIIHYGGDGGDAAWYRTGTLLLHHNTILSQRSGSTTLVRLSTAAESADIRNNVVISGGPLAIVEAAGTATLTANALPKGWRDTFADSLDGAVIDAGNLTGDPGLGVDHVPQTGAAVIGTAADPHADAEPVLMQYVQHRSGQSRPDQADIGALAAP